MKILCTPQSLFTSKYRLKGSGHYGSIELNSLFSSGSITLNGTTYPVVKGSFLSGQWQLQDRGKTLLSATKVNPFTRSFEIEGHRTSATLKATNPFSRTMELANAEGFLRISPNHAFTRKALIEGSLNDVILAAFSFWLTAMVWRQASRNRAA